MSINRIKLRACGALAKDWRPGSDAAGDAKRYTEQEI
jgi:hypothetical protein